MEPFFYRIDTRSKSPYPTVEFEHVIAFSSSQDYGSQAKGKYMKLVEMYFPTNVAMNLSKVDQSRYERTYLKINEMWLEFGIEKMSTFIDIGADPGAFSIYMLVKKMTGIGLSIVNKALQDKIRGKIIKPFYKNKTYSMIRKDFFDSDLVNDFDPSTDVITCDIGRGGNNKGKWDSYDMGLGVTLANLLKSDRYDDMSDFEFHIMVLDRCVKLFNIKKAKVMIVKMFNINEHGIHWDAAKKRVVYYKVAHKDRLFEYLAKHIGPLEVYIHKPESSQSMNNEFYLIFAEKVISDIPVISWNESLSRLVERKTLSLESLSDFFNNISLEVFAKSKSLRIEEDARDYLDAYNLPVSFENEVSRKNSKLIRF